MQSRATMDVRGIQAGGDQLIAVGRPAIESQAIVAIRIRREPRIGVERRAGGVRGVTCRVRVACDVRCERFANFRPNLITAGADAGADGGDEVFGPASILLLETAHRGGSNVGGRATPSGVNGGDRAGEWVGHQQGHTISDLHDERDAVFIRHDAVRFRRVLEGLRG